VAAVIPRLGLFISWNNKGPAKTHLVHVNGDEVRAACSRVVLINGVLLSGASIFEGQITCSGCQGKGFAERRGLASVTTQLAV
jgi:hypothetical protein